ncbi:putative multi-domain containing protein, partial [Aduncisulcus paluster]
MSWQRALAEAEIASSFGEEAKKIYSTLFIYPYSTIGDIHDATDIPFPTISSFLTLLIQNNIVYSISLSKSELRRDGKKHNLLGHASDQPIDIFVVIPSFAVLRLCFPLFTHT